jgi:hypothetical protein
MSLHTLTERYCATVGTLTDERARAILASLPTSDSRLSPDTVEDCRSVAVIVAHGLADDDTVRNAIGTAWHLVTREALRDASRSDVSIGDTYAEADSAALDLPYAWRPDPSAPFRITSADVLATAVGILRESDPRTVDLLRVARLAVLLADGPRDWHDGAPIRDGLVSAARTLRVTVNRRTVRADVLAAFETVAETARNVTRWATYRHAHTWTGGDVQLELAASAVVMPGQPCAPSVTGTATSGPASAVVIRHRDSIGDAWRAEYVTGTTETETDDGDTVTTETVVTYLRAMTDDDARAALDTVDGETFRRTADVLTSDRWADRLAWTPGPVAKPNRLKRAGSGQTGPTVPARLR